jgi:putative ABC transport system ATP-binding protein
MVTHDPVSASYSRRVVFVADGRVVDDLDEPTPAAVLERMRGLGQTHLEPRSVGRDGE